MKPAHALLSLMTAAVLACVDETDDTQVLASASTVPATFEANSALEVIQLDSASCASDSKRTEPGFEVYESAEAFRSAYAMARPHATYVPEIDFTRYVVVASYLGSQASCQTEVAIGSATVLSDRVNVDVKIAHADGCGASGALAYPFAFARLDRVDLPYFAADRSEPKSCP